MSNIKKLHLSKKDKKIVGICGGIGEAFGVDSTIVRMVCIFLALVTSIIPAVAVYAVGWLIIPSK
ncbi:PspC domain-containing protein [Candidatus Campbellbacteria bacterium RIFOXYC2_FULL_35_25]|uniref:PspC domain-containing protein n=1 Tax=Candidatus Campbellbacteria bacterium RIFOXYC2_FULL_35_25 TaxID=1797582 RepID=A0A1F5EJ52_9BACT|nr:MAG: PspC domain-containing protein [Candidatus Campbellbacteria bacterium RIFOXYC2_FULL_35_25]